MKKTHISARDYEILVSGQGKTLDQVINNVGNNNRGDDLVPITIVTVEEVAQYIYDTYQSSIVIPVLQKFSALNNDNDIDIELFNRDAELLPNIIENYEGFDSVEYVKEIIIGGSLVINDFTWIFPFIISHNITTTIIFTANSFMNMPESFIPSVFPSGHILNKINIGQVKKGAGAFICPIKIITEYDYSSLSSDDFTYISGRMKIETNTLNADYFMDNESKFIFKASVHQA